MDDYKLVKYGVQRLEELEAEVKSLIIKGWKPVGELKIIEIDRQQVAVQQMEFKLSSMTMTLQDDDVIRR